MVLTYFHFFFSNGGSTGFALFYISYFPLKEGDNELGKVN